MNTTQLLTLFITLVLTVACQTEDDSSTVDPGIPIWLQERIQEDEAVIASDSTLLPNYGV